MSQWTTHLVTFFSGTATGAAGGYFAAKFTDRRREKESKSRAQRQFREIVSVMPELIAEMCGDFSNPEHCTMRELVLLPNRRAIFNSDQKRFVYFEEEHDGLWGKLTILENYGHIIDVTPGNTPIYRVTEEFYQAVRTSS